MKHLRARAPQQGAVLFVGLIMLILITLLAVSAIRLANTNLLVVGNEQFQKEAEDAANYHLDLALNSNEFTARNVNRSAPLPAFSGAAVTPETNYTVTVPPPKCKRYRYIKQNELLAKRTVTVTEVVEGVETAVEKVEDYVPIANVACFGGKSNDIMIIDPTTNTSGNSLCATSLWEMTANVELPNASAKAQVAQGVEMRIDYAEAQSACK